MYRLTDYLDGAREWSGNISTKKEYILMFEIIIVNNIFTGKQERTRHPYKGKRLIDVVDIKGLIKKQHVGKE